LRSFFTVLGLYAVAALFVGYFAINAFSGNHGLRAKQQLEEQIADLAAELRGAEIERAQWERRVSLLRADGVDPDLLDERARAELHYLHPRELTLMVKPR
jgi:cell division protein FtsB